MLALVGSGEYLPPVEAVDRYLLECLGVPARVVCLPTAAGTEGQNRVSYWMDLGVQHFTRLGAQVFALPLISRTDAENPQFVDQLRDANFIYLSGGKPNYLFETLSDTPAWQVIRGIHDNGGVVAGCSAGAMIMGERIFSFTGTDQGFGLLPGTIILPHFDEYPGWMSEIANLGFRNHSSILGIDSSTALIVDQTGLGVRGRGTVFIWDRSGKKRYREGETIPALVH